MDPEQIAIMEALRRLGAVPHQRDINVAPRSEPYMDALSEADPRDMGANEQFVMRNAPVIPEYTGHDEMDPNEMEPDNDYDDFMVRQSAAQAGVRNNPAQWRAAESMYGQAVGAPEDPDDMTRLRDGREMSYRDALGQSGTTNAVTMANMVDRGYTTGTQHANIGEDLNRRAAANALGRLRGGR